MRLRQRLMGLLAVLVLAGILVGLPAVLIALGGNPLPTQVPNLDQVRDALLAPDDGTLVLAAARLLGWVVWALLVLTLLVELASQIGGIEAPSLPGLGMPQAAVRPLVTAALALFIAVPTAGLASAAPVSAAPSPAVTAPATVTATVQLRPSTPVADDAPADTQAEAVEHETYVVQAGDTLWSIAQKHLGSGRDFHRIVAANPDQLSQGADWINPGMELKIPLAAPAREGKVTVVEGDTLSGLAAHHLDDADRWPELYEATAGVPQPDGRVLSDPDLIYPGWQIEVPGHGISQGGDAAGDARVEASPDGTAAQTRAQVDVDTAAGEAPIQLVPGGDAAGGAGDVATRPVEASLAGAALGVTPGSTPATAPAAPHEVSTQDHAADPGTEDQAPGWLLPGLVGSGALLGGAMFLALGARRRAAFRHRRPGRALSTPAPALAPVEKTVQSEGAAAAVTLRYLDEVLHRLGGLSQRTDAPVPVLAAAQLSDDCLTLHLSQPADLGAPWEGSEDRLHWRLPVTAQLEELGPLEVDGPAPYPLLVSIGAGDDGSWWLLNLEDLQVQITGDPVYVEDLARYLAAEIAVNPWSAGVRLACVGVGEEVVPMNPIRLRAAGPEALQDLLADAVSVVDRLGEVPDVPTARLHRTGEERWPARMLLLSTDHAADPVAGAVRQLLTDQPGRTGSAMVVVGGQELHPDAVHIVVGDDGRLQLPGPGLDVIGVGLTLDEARGCAALLMQAVESTDIPMPDPAAEDQAAEPWRAWVDQAGRLRPEHTNGREEDLEPSTTLLPEEDQDYLTAAATTTQDLEALAPRVSAEVGAQIVEADPALDADLAAWWDQEARLPKLTLLGPVSVKTWGKAMSDRRPYFTEMVAYLALHPAGSTPADTAEAFSISNDKCRDYVGRCREWLGSHPESGLLHLPYASDAPASTARGVNVYQVVDVLIDVDLFRRLRTRAEARGGEEGIEDLREALKLVQGQPFDQLRRQGWGWLFESDRLDQHMVCAIVDVAHIVTTHDLATGNIAGARAAAETAALAGPDEEIPTLDRVAVLHAEGRSDQAVQVLKGVGNRSDDPDELPEDLPSRTKEILDSRSWLDQRPAG